MLNESAFGLTDMKLFNEIERSLIDWSNTTSISSDIEDSVTKPTLNNFRRDPLYVVIPISIIYVTIFFTGLIGNVSTCVVIARNKSMHTATNYYLFSLAISDLLLLISGLPPEMYYIWSNYPYVFGEHFCIIQSFAAETSANATVLTITAFTVERYVAICHPFLSHTMSKLSRAVKFVIVIWLLALCLAIPQAIQFGIVYQRLTNGTLIEGSATCSVKWTFMDHAFEISTILFFGVPMTVITVLYVLIGVKLRNSRLLANVKRNPLGREFGHSESARGKGSAQRNVIRMLVAVVVAFFICWAPFHAQRLLAVYAENNKKDGRKTAIVLPVYTALTYVSGVFYYLSTTINPLLYNIMSNKFREAFKAMLSKHCGRRLQKASPSRPAYSSLTRYPRSSINRADPQISASLSVSDETHKLPQAGGCQGKTSITQLVHDNSCSPIINKNEPASETENPLRYDLPNFESLQMKPIKFCRKTQFAKNGQNKSSESSSYNQVNDTASLEESCIKGNQNNNQNSQAKSHKHRKVKLGILADHLKIGASGLFAVRPSAIRLRMKVEKKPADATLTLMTEKPTTSEENCQNQPGIERANTISNSSLQDLDETEFTSRELARYMGELNVAC